MDEEQRNKGIQSHLHETHLAAGEETIITDLNDDCLESIFEFVQDLPSQVKIAKCCQRFRDIMTCLWKRRLHHGRLHIEQWATALPNDGDFKYYINAMRTEFRTITTEFKSLAIVLRIKNIVFPCVERLDHVGYLPDPAIYRLSKIVPNIKYLFLLAWFTGNHLKRFQYLEELHLIDADCNLKRRKTSASLFNLKHLRVLDIRGFYFNSLNLGSKIQQCSKLEVLKLGLSTLRASLVQVLELPQLKHLSVHNDELDRFEEYYEILRRKGPQIQGVVVDFQYTRYTSWPADFGYLQPQNLKILGLFNRKFDASMYGNRIFARLEILYLVNTHPRTADILEMLRLCPVLKCLDISDNPNMNHSLLKDILNYLQKEKPNQVLHLRYTDEVWAKEIKENNSFWAAQTHLMLHEFSVNHPDFVSRDIVGGFSFHF